MSDDTVRTIIAAMREASSQCAGFADRIEQALAQPAAREVGEEECAYCVDGTVPMTFDRPCPHCTPLVSTKATTPPAPAAGDGLPELLAQLHKIDAFARNLALGQEIELRQLAHDAIKQCRQLGRASR